MAAWPPHVLGADLRRGIPFPDGEFDAVYHSHVLEHFDREGGLRLLRECHRVLQPGGCLRVVVPDLESIARGYLEALEAVRTDKGGAARYEWMRLELFDQMTRERSGGEMHRHLLTMEADGEFIAQRMGIAGAQMLASARRQSQQATGGDQPPASWRWREALAHWLLGPDAEALDLGRFRRGGEIHLQMYDSHALGEALKIAGFAEPQVCSATSSAIPGWTGYRLDTEPDGAVYKADSLFMEALKP